MSGQQLDLTAAFAAAELAIDGVEANADTSWLDVARGVVRSIPIGLTFTTDDVWRALARASVTVSTHEPRAMGAVMRGLQRDGVVVNTRTYQPSARPECHARPIPVWRRV